MNPLIIGAGPNGLAAAFYLAKAGMAPLVLERSGQVGGGAITREIAPGFSGPALSHEVLVHERIVREMNLAAHGLELLTSDVDLCAPSPDGPAIVIHGDPSRSARSLEAVSQKDARSWPGFCAAIDRVASVLGPVLESPPPDIDRPAFRDLLKLLGVGRKFRALGSRDAHRLLRWLPMPVSDFVGEWFESDRLKAAVAGAGVSGTMLGPKSAGSSLMLLLRETHRRLAGGRVLRVRGGPGALSRAMASAARAGGAEIRERTAVDAILLRNGAVAGVVAAGREIAARTVVSGVDPKTTLLTLVDPQELEPDVLVKTRNYRAAGTLAKVNLALSALPQFAGIGDPGALAGRIHIGPGLDYLERAFDHVKYGEMSAEPWLDVTLPSVVDASLAPPGAHVASIYVHCAPYRLENAGWDAAARELLLRRTLNVLERHAPGVSRLVVAAEVISPSDLETVHGLAGGHIFHGEMAPDQLFAMRPLLGFGRYRSPVRGLYLCGAGTHPGGFLTATSGRLCAEEIVRGARADSLRA
jgi:phytoene dehydrogenase-like protein